MLADYLVVRNRTLKIESLYIGNSQSIYWYESGIHWREVLAWVLGTWPTFPGFVMTLRDPLSTSNWAKLFKIAFFVGSFAICHFKFDQIAYIPCTQVSRYPFSRILSYANYHPLLILEKVWIT
jgi:cytosine/uracil/thiamine/allantoin permease